MTYAFVLRKQDLHRLLLPPCLERLEPFQPLSESRMGVVVRRVPRAENKTSALTIQEDKTEGNVQPINPNSRQVLDMQSNQSPSQPLTHIPHARLTQLILELNRKPISLILIVPANGIHPDAHERLQGRQDHLEQQERNDRRRVGRHLFREAERAEEGRGVQEGGEEGEDGEDVELGDGHHFGGVHMVPVAELVCEHGFDFFGFALLDEGVEDDDVFGLF